jgi:uncharacterized protein DUF3300
MGNFNFQIFLWAWGKCRVLGLFLLLFFLGIGLSSPLRAQQISDASPLFSQKQLEDLVAPIALYPDPLLAQILAASTYPLDIVNAARFLETNKNAAQINNQDWDTSVKAIAHYPNVLAMMNDQLEWTQKLGQAMVTQQKQVMDAIQVLRHRAKNNGSLKDTPQQSVIVQDDIIVIVPAQPDVIYVPQYDYNVVYEYSDIAPLITFSFGFLLGSWFDLGCNWWDGYFYYGEPYYWRHWYHHRGWHPPNVNHYPTWNHNPSRGGPFTGYPGGRIPVASTPGTTTGGYTPPYFGGDKGKHPPYYPGTPSSPRGKAPGNRPFYPGMDRSPQRPTNIFGGVGDGHSAKINSQRGGQSVGGGGFGSFGGFHPGGTVYYPRNRGGFGNWGRSPSGGGFQGSKGGHPTGGGSHGGSSHGGGSHGDGSSGLGHGKH